MSSPYQDPNQPPYSQPPYGQPQYAPPPPPAYPQQGMPATGYMPPSPMGQPQMANYVQPVVTIAPNGLALTSMIAGILSLTLCGTVAAIVAVITGHMGLSRANQLPPQLARRGMALAGLIMGYVSLGLTILIIIFVIATAGASSSIP